MKSIYWILDFYWIYTFTLYRPYNQSSKEDEEEKEEEVYNSTHMDIHYFTSHSFTNHMENSLHQLHSTYSCKRKPMIEWTVRWKEKLEE